MSNPIKLPILYCRRTDGGINQWTIEVDGARYRTISGVVDGSLVTSAWTECVVKNGGRANETTPEVQAMAEAQAKWKKKVENKYTENPNAVDTDRIFQVMLAKDIKDHKAKVDVEFKKGGKVYAQRKLDGIRCAIKADGMWTRNGKAIVSCPHIFDAIQHLFVGQPDLVLDGELFNDDLKDNFNLITSLVKKQKPIQEDFDRSAELIHYHIYDLAIPNEPFVNRCKGYQAICAMVDKPFLIPVTTYECADWETLDTLYGEWLQEGQEGQIIRFNSVYENKRTDRLLKRKEFTDKEFVITGVQSGVGKAANLACKMNFVAENGEPFDATTTGPEAIRTRYLQEIESLKGKLATVRFGNRTPDRNVPRWGRVIAIRDYE
jgi:DNA ligase-1